MSSVTPLRTAPPSDRLALRERLESLCRNRAGLAAQPSGFAELDAHLPGGGWPMGALTECLLDRQGIGELSLWMPALCALARAHRYIAFINPPFGLYAPAFVQRGFPLAQLRVIACGSQEDSLWAVEQTLRCAAFGAVLAWPAGVTDKQLRRLQLAAEEGRNLGILYRSLGAAREPSPAALRIKLTASAAPKDPRPENQKQDNQPPDDLQITIHKCRGLHANATLHCTLQRFAATAGNAV